MKADKKTEKAVLAVLNKTSEVYARRDVEGFLALFAPDEDVFVYGTGLDEKRQGLAEIRAQVERDWSQTEAASFEIGWHTVSAVGTIAWAAADITFNVKMNGHAMSMPARMTTVLEKRGDRWLVVQSHFSTPMAGQEEGESWATESMAQSR